MIYKKKKIEFLKTIPEIKILVFPSPEISPKLFLNTHIIKKINKKLAFRPSSTILHVHRHARCSEQMKPLGILVAE